MKNLFILLLLIITSITYSQKKVSYSGYIPAITRHYVPAYTYTSDEGGNAGVILSRRVSNDNSKFYSETSFGVIRNSYGNASVVVLQGFGVEVVGLNIGTAVGLASGYEEYYKTSPLKGRIPGLFVNNGIMAYAGVNLSLAKGLKISNSIRVTPMVYVTPLFVNAGVKFNLTK
jgi:hypothetical protein